MIPSQRPLCTGGSCGSIRHQRPGYHVRVRRNRRQGSQWCPGSLRSQHHGECWLAYHISFCRGLWLSVDLKTKSCAFPGNNPYYFSCSCKLRMNVNGNIQMSSKIYSVLKKCFKQRKMCVLHTNEKVKKNPSRRFSCRNFLTRLTSAPTSKVDNRGESYSISQT